MVRFFNRVRDGVLEKKRKIQLYLGLMAWYAMIGTIVEYGFDYNHKKQGEGIIGGLVTGLVVIAIIEMMLRFMPRAEQAVEAQALLPEIPMHSVEASRVINPDGQCVIAIEEKAMAEEERMKLLL